jgi:hypothetical protein
MCKEDHCIVAGHCEAGDRSRAGLAGPGYKFARITRPSFMSELIERRGSSRIRAKYRPLVRPGDRTSADFKRATVALVVRQHAIDVDILTSQNRKSRQDLIGPVPRVMSIRGRPGSCSHRRGYSEFSSCGIRPRSRAEDFCDVPQADVVVIPGRESEGSTIRRECHGSEVHCLAIQASLSSAGCNRPESQHSVVAGGRQERPVRGESDRIHWACMALEYIKIRCNSD